MDGPKLPSSHDSSISLIARLDHLEFIMKYLERKQRCGSINVPGDKQSSELAMKEAYFKGTLLDRVASLEQRLRQLCEEMDSSGSSHPLSRASTETSGESSSSHDQGSKGHVSYPFPTFNNNAHNQIMPLNHNNNTLQSQEKNSEIVKHQRKNTSPPKQQQVVKNNRSKKNEKKCKNGKKQTTPLVTWPHLKLLGC